MADVIFIKNNQSIPLPPHYRKLINDAVRETLKYEKAESECEVSVTFVDDATIKELNKEYRNTDKSTDVLSFPIFDDEPSPNGKVVLGDIVISVETAKKQADEYGHGIERELSFLTIHSMLHLLGYDHETGEEDEREMFRRQKEILSLLGLERKG